MRRHIRVTIDPTVIVRTIVGAGSSARAGFNARVAGSRLFGAPAFPSSPVPHEEEEETTRAADEAHRARAVVIGAGVVGLAVAREVRLVGRSRRRA